MDVTFERTRERRYAVTVARAERSDLRVDPAPGYDSLLPHDLVHFVVEAEFGLRDGIFGQLAAGGNAGLFVPTEEQRTKAWARRTQRRNRATGRDMAESEDLAAQVFPRWLRHRGLSPASQYALVEPPASTLSGEELERAFERLDELSRKWRSLGVGQSMSVTWPWPERPARRG